LAQDREKESKYNWSSEWLFTAGSYCAQINKTWEMRGQRKISEEITDIILKKGSKRSLEAKWWKVYF
jgi:hypothetical protein